jgi:chemotaxis protein histidine kinase CheA
MSLGDLVEKFRGVALERVEKMNVLLVELEREPQSAQIEELTREIHTLKGEAQMMGFADVNLVSHLTEHLMLEAASNEFRVGEDRTELMFEGLDLLRTLLTKTAGGAASPIDLAGFVDRVTLARAGEPAGTLEEESDPVPTGLDAESSVSFDERPTTVQRKADESVLLRIQTGGSVRVDLEKLERIGEVSGELLLASRRLDFQLGALEGLRDDFLKLRSDVGDLLPKAHYHRMRELSHRIDVVLGELRTHVSQNESRATQLDGQTRELRHFPLEHSLQHYPRAVRDLAAAQGKSVRFEQDVAGVDVDRAVLNAIAEPLLHLVRNAVDHGIEPPDEREAAGKAPDGRISLAAEYAGDSVRVILEDDGRGIDPRLISNKAEARGLKTRSELKAMSADEVLGLIFEPGFSTRDEVTDVSGRGIGMDVVRRQIGAIGGTVDISSEVGAGTEFTLTLPISSAVGTVLAFVIDEQAFAVPAKDVRQIEFVDYDTLHRGPGGLEVILGEELIPLANWKNVLGDFRRNVPRGRLTVMFLRRGGRSVALWVDDVVGEREGMTRPLGEFLSGIRICRGVAITDAGEVLPMLNVNELLSAENVTPDITETTTRATMELSRPKRVKTVLVVEDSEVTRALVLSILRTQGYRVLEAEDGQQGLDRLQEQRVDLVLTDVQMPRMDGFTMLERMRADARFADLPVIILTTLGAPEDKERAMSLGADGYLVKLDFEEEELIRTVRRFLQT